MSFESLWLYKSRTVWVEITLFISLTLRAETHVEQKKWYSEVFRNIKYILNTYELDIILRDL